jgi:hypothetical protein
MAHFKLTHHLFFILFSHPVLVLHFLKDLSHEFLKITKIGKFTLPLWIDFLINQIHQIIDHLHNKIVVVSLFSVFEHYLRVSKVVVVQRLNVIHFTHYFFQSLVDFS